MPRIIKKALFSLIGPIICEVPKEVVSERTIKAEIQPIYTDFKIPRDAKKTDGTIDYSKLTTFLSEDEDRNDTADLPIGYEDILHPEGDGDYDSDNDKY